MNIPASTFETQPESTQLWFLSLAFADLTESETAARSALQLVKNNNANEPLYFALTEVAVVRYSKPHKGNRLPDGRGTVRLPASFIPSDDYSQRLHKLLIEARDKSMAHSDMSVRDARIVRIPDDQDGGSVWEGRTSSNTIDPATLNRLPELCIATRRRLLPAIKALAEKVMPNAVVGQVFELRPNEASLMTT